MKIGGLYSFKDGKKTVAAQRDLFKEVTAVIARIDAPKLKTKVSKEKTMRGRLLYDPKKINKAFKKGFTGYGWSTVRVACEYTTTHFVEDYALRSKLRGAFREMDFVKKKLGVEVQFGKYAFMVYNVCAKMTIFRNLGKIDCGIEIVPMKDFAEEMSTGVSFFEQIVWDLENRGIADIDIPVLVIGLTV